MLQNKIYVGKIFIPAFKDEAERVVEGLHEAIVDSVTFEQVQFILSGKKKHIKAILNLQRHL